MTRDVILLAASAEPDYLWIRDTGSEALERVWHSVPRLMESEEDLAFSDLLDELNTDWWILDGFTSLASLASRILDVTMDPPLLSLAEELRTRSSRIVAGALNPEEMHLSSSYSFAEWRYGSLLLTYGEFRIWVTGAGISERERVEHLVEEVAHGQVRALCSLLGRPYGVSIDGERWIDCRTRRIPWPRRSRRLRM